VFGAARFRRHAAGVSLAALVGTGAVAVLSPMLVLTADIGALGSPVVSAKAHAVSLIPTGVRVSASNQLGGHLSERRYITTFPFGVRSRWIAVDINDSSYHDPARFKRVVRRYEADTKTWRIVFSSHGVAVLERRR
jgi:hypothetical protein